MKPRTALMILAVGVLLLLPYLFIREPENQALLMQEFTYLGMRFTVVRGLVIALILAAVVPSLWFSFALMRMAGRHNKERAENRDERSSARREAAALLAHGCGEAALEKLGDGVDEESLILRGRALLAMGDREAATESLTTAFEEHGSVAAGYLLAESHGDDGVGILQRMIDAAPDRAVRAYRGLLRYAVRTNDWERAVALIEAMKRHDLPYPEEELPAYRVAWIREQNDLPAKKRIEYYQKILKHTPDHVPANVGLGEVYLSEGMADKAFRLFEQAFAGSKNTVFPDRMVSYTLESGRPDDAIQIYRRMVAQYDTPALHFQLARLYFRLEMLDDALDELETLEPLLGDVPGYRIMTAEIKARRDRHEEAFADLRHLHASAGINAYRCARCEQETEQWVPRCGSCGAWDKVEHVAADVATSIEGVAGAPVW